MPYKYSIIKIPYLNDYPCSLRKAVMDNIRQRVANFLTQIGWISYRSGGGGSYYEYLYGTNSYMQFTITDAQLCTAVHPGRKRDYVFNDPNNNDYLVEFDKYFLYKYKLELFINKTEYLSSMSSVFTNGNLVSVCINNRAVAYLWDYRYKLIPFYPWKVLSRYYDGSRYRIVLESFPMNGELFYVGWPLELPSVPNSSPFISLSFAGFSPFTQTFVSRGENDDRPPIYVTFDFGAFYSAWRSMNPNVCYPTDVGFVYVSDTYPHGSVCNDSDSAMCLILPTHYNEILSLYLYGDKNFVIIIYETPYFGKVPLLCCGHVPVFAPIGKMRNEMKDVDPLIHRKVFTSADKLFYDYSHYSVNAQVPDPKVLYGKNADYFIPFFFFGVDKSLSDNVPLFHSHFLGFSLPWLLVRVSGSSNHPDFCVFGRVYSGISTGGNTAETLNDTNANWDTDVFKGKTLALVGGTGGFGQVRKIISNSRTRLIVDRPFDVIPDNTTKYVICNFFYRRLKFDFVPWNIEIFLDWKFIWESSLSFYCLEHPDYYVEV